MFTVPIDSPEYRCNLDGKFRVARTRDAGDNWEILADSLPPIYSVSVGYA